MENDLLSRVGPEGSPLRRIKVSKEDKLAIEQMLKAKQYPPHISLRAYLAIGRVPPNDLVTEENIAKALRPEDSLGSLHLTGRRVPFVNVQIPLAAVSKGLAMGSKADPERLAMKLEQYARKWESLKAGPRLTEKSVYEFIHLVGMLAERTASGRRDGKYAQSLKKRRNPFGPLVRLVIRFAKESDQQSRLAAVNLIAALCRARTTDIEEQLDEDPGLKAALAGIWERTILDVERMALGGNAAEFGGVGGHASGHSV